MLQCQGCCFLEAIDTQCIHPHPGPYKLYIYIYTRNINSLVFPFGGVCARSVACSDARHRHRIDGATAMVNTRELCGALFISYELSRITVIPSLSDKPAPTAKTTELAT